MPVVCWEPSHSSPTSPLTPSSTARRRHTLLPQTRPTVRDPQSHRSWSSQTASSKHHILLLCVVQVWLRAVGTVRLTACSSWRIWSFRPLCREQTPRRYATLFNASSLWDRWEKIFLRGTRLRVCDAATLVLMYLCSTFQNKSKGTEPNTRKHWKSIK